jgi:hypothetical protein
MTVETALILAGGCAVAAAMLQRMPGSPSAARRRGRADPTDGTPAVRELAAGATERRRGPAGRAPEELQGLVSPVTWDLIQPDRPPPHDARERGISVSDLEIVLDDLERLSGGR